MRKAGGEGQGGGGGGVTAEQQVGETHTGGQGRGWSG